mmetsp:Transcript_20451/g.22813  ORF Transcript_20451/g.22813 Transcript_20451/m.22813 type:complete len:479 (-) Transcript_20451:221-1657(-)
MRQPLARSSSISRSVAPLSLWRRLRNSALTLIGNKKSYYLDYNGTTPIYKEVFDSMTPYMNEHFGNPSSSHLFGTEPRKAIQKARTQILQQLLGVTVEDGGKRDNSALDLSSIWFTGCGTESDNLAIKLALLSSCSEEMEKKNTHQHRRNIVTCNVEHPAIEMYLQHLEKDNNDQDQKIDVTRVSVDTEGRVSATDIIKAITPDTVLVTLMLANNESGALQPVKEVSEECRRRGVLFHTDAAQAAGKVPIGLHNIGFPDMVTIVGHKIGAPKGVAALYVRPGCLNEYGRQFSHANNGGVMLIGGGQEFGQRGGTENTPYIVGLGQAAEMAQVNLKRNAAHMEQLRTQLLENLIYMLGEENVRVNGPIDPKKRLPNTLSVGLNRIRSSELLSSIGHVVAISAGAACHSTGGSISSVLLAMKVPESFARGTLRVSVGPTTTIEEIDDASEIIARAAKAQWKELDIKNNMELVEPKNAATQ